MIPMVSNKKQEGVSNKNTTMGPAQTHNICTQFVSHIEHVSSPLQKQLMVAEFCLLGYNAVYSSENQPTFRRNMSSLSSESKNKPSKKPACKRDVIAACFELGFFFRLLFHPEDGCDIFIRNVSRLSKEYMALYLRRQNS
jgi:hypothetical protein